MMDIDQLMEVARAEQSIAAALSMLQHEVREVLQRDDVESWSATDLHALAVMIREARNFAHGDRPPAPPRHGPFHGVDIDAVHRLHRRPPMK